MPSCVMHGCAAYLEPQTSPEELYWVSLVAELRKQLQVGYATTAQIRDHACYCMYNRFDRDRNGYR